VSKQIFISLPVRDLGKAIPFYEAIGGTRNPQFSDDTGACMVLSDSIFVMLLTHAKWATFTTKPIVDSQRESEVAFNLSADSRADVDKIVAAAAAKGGQADINPPQDQDFMYARTCADVDGHVWEFLYLDMSQMPKG
jgi:uncharacterized protein